MKKAANPLQPYEIESIAVIAAYGWPYEFTAVDDAIAYVEAISRTVEDPEAPLMFIEAQVKFTNGESDQAKRTSEERLLHWLKQYQKPSETDRP